MDGKIPRLVTLTTDWSKQDFYFGMLYGKIISISPEIRIVNLSHNISPFNYTYAAFIIKHSFRHFPEHSVHICMVNSDSSPKNRLLLFEHQKHYFIVPDNGSISLIADEFPLKIFGYDTVNSSFGSLDAIGNALSNLLANSDMSQYIVDGSGIKKLTPMLPVIEADSITGKVIYIDSYQNAITNISHDEFENERKSRRFTIYLQSYSYSITAISQSYNDVEGGELLAIFNSLGLLEIALRDGPVAQLFNLTVNSSILIQFQNEEKILKS